MSSVTWLRFYFTFRITIMVLLLTSCGVDSQAIPNQTLTPLANSNVGNLAQEAVNPTLRLSTENPTETFLPAKTPEVLTVTPSPPHALPLTTIECGKNSESPSPILQPDLDIRFSQIVIDHSLLYLATGQYIGQFDISDPKQPALVGFWELQDLTVISNMEIYGGVAYITSGSTLYLLNLSPECKFETIATVKMPFEIFHLELEEDRVYVGGYSESRDQLHIQVFSNRFPAELRELGTVDLEPAIWSVSGHTIFSLETTGLFITDASDLNDLLSRPGTVIPDAILSNISSWQIVDDKVYLLSDAEGFRIVANLMNDSPTVYHNSERYLLVGFFKPQKHYVFLGTLGCEGGDIECGSVVYILNANDAEELASLALRSYGDIFNYQEIEQSIVYAFSATSLIIIELTNNNPTVIGDIPFK